jgi:hypothetical protein
MATPPGHSSLDRDAARIIISVQADYAARGTHLATAALAGAKSFVEWDHYPHGDYIDQRHGTEFYYHAHEASRRMPDEHGHFHVFARHADGSFWHLTGISLDNRGRATRLFTTNRWVTGEAWATTPEMIPAIHRFALRSSGRLTPVARWIDAMVRLYRPLIIELLEERDAWLATAEVAKREERLDDRSVHIVTERSISLFGDLGNALEPKFQ